MVLDLVIIVGMGICAERRSAVRSGVCYTVRPPLVLLSHELDIYIKGFQGCNLYNEVVKRKIGREDEKC